MHKKLASIFAITILTASIARADVKLPRVFTDNMVLQREMKVPVWGWAEPGEKVIVAIDGKQASATADAKGEWSVRLGPFAAGGPVEVTVTGKNTITLKNVLFGEVWICSGQSNMQMGLGGVNNAGQEVAAANFPQIRLLTVNNVTSQKPLAEVPTSGWVECSPQTAGGFTAVGYFFGRHLRQTLNVPIGLINTSWGGTICEAWTSADTLLRMPDFKGQVEQFQKLTIGDQTAALKEYNDQLAAWQKTFEAALNADAGANWQDPAFNVADWKEMKLPVHWEEAGLPNFDGIVWFRREIELPADWKGKDLNLSLGPIDDEDVTWVNGTKVGATAGYMTPRKYKVPADLTGAGKLAIVVRVLDTGGGGGIYGKPDEMKLEADGQSAISLAGPWRYRVGAGMDKLPPRPSAPPGVNNPNVTTALYNAMIAPLIPYGIRGAIWYQGESNAGRSYQYRELFPAMIQDWRTHWGEGDFSFGFVQLANFMSAKSEPGESSWAELREAQNMTLSLKNTGQAVIIDVGDAADIHPKNKQDVGKRLALWAEGTTYGKKIVYSGPRYKSMKVEGGKIRLSFDHIGGGLIAKGGELLKQFAIAGADKKFVWADAKIDGNTVVVSSDKIPQPVAVRYAWADNPDGCNLYNKEELPATPFRTDDWPGVTANAK